MPDGESGNLRPSPDFRERIEATVAAIREQMEERLADRDAQIARLFAERQELRRLVTAAQATERTAREEAAGLRISERDAVAEVAALHQQLEVTERQARALRTQLDEAQASESNALELLKHVTAAASEQRKRADDARADADTLRRTRVDQLQVKLDQLYARGIWARLRNKR